MKIKKNIRLLTLFIVQTFKKLCSNSLYFRLHKMINRIDLCMYILESTFLSDFVIFMYPIT
jgi:hypothetical protein